MLTSDQIEALRDQTAKLVDPIQDYLLREIARRIADAGQLTSTAAYQIWRAQQLGLSRKEIEQELQRLLGVSRTRLRELLVQSAQVGYDFDLQHSQSLAGGVRSQAAAHPFNRADANVHQLQRQMQLTQLVAAAVEQADRAFTNLTQTMGFIAPDGRAYPLREAAIKTIDFAFGQVITGVTDHTTAVRRAVQALADQGIQAVGYESGVSVSLEAAVQRDMMGGLGLLQEKISQQNHDTLEADGHPTGWEISAHANSAPDHEPIQGRQYSDADYLALNNRLVRRIGTLNCGHAAFPILLGISQPQYSEEQLRMFREQNEKGVEYQGRRYSGYEATQKQRQLERAIRRQKRRVLVDRATGDDEKRTTDQIRLRRYQEEYRRFSQTAGLRTEEQRIWVTGNG